MALGDKYPLTVLVSLGRSDRLIIREHGDKRVWYRFSCEDRCSIRRYFGNVERAWVGGASSARAPSAFECATSGDEFKDDPTCLWWDIISSNLSGRPLNKAPPTSNRKKNKSVTRCCMTPASKRPKRKLRLIARQPKHISKNIINSGAGSAES